MSTVELDDPLAPEALGIEPAAAPAAAAPAPKAAPKSTIVDMATGEVVEPKTDIAELPPEDRALVVLKSTQTELDLKALIERTKPLTAIADKASRELVHRGAMDHKNARLAIQRASDAATEDAKAFTKAVGKESKRLIGLNAEEETRLFTLRDEYDDAEKERMAEEARVEALRVGAIREKIDGIKALPQNSINDDTETLSGTLIELRAFEVTFEDFAEFMDEAQAVINEALEQLDALLTASRNRDAANAAAAAANALVEQERAAATEREAALKAQIEALQAQLAANAPKADAAPIEEQHPLADAYRISLIDTDGSSLDGWREIGTNADGDYVYESAGMRAIWTGDFSVKEVAHMPAAERLAEFKIESEIYAHVEAEHAAAVTENTPAEPNQAAAYMRDNPPPSPGNAVDDFFAEPGYTIREASDAKATLDGLDCQHSGHTYSPALTLADVGEAVLGFDKAAGPDVTVEMVSISKEEYEKLLGDAKLLDALYAGGVEQWEGYEAALAAE